MNVHNKTKTEWADCSWCMICKNAHSDYCVRYEVPKNPNSQYDNELIVDIDWIRPRLGIGETIKQKKI